MMIVVYSIKPAFPHSSIYLISSILIGIIVYFSPMLFWDKELKSDIKEGWKIIRNKQ